jgi:hypothetical protein
MEKLNKKEGKQWGTKEKKKRKGEKPQSPDNASRDPIDNLMH